MKFDDLRRHWDRLGRIDPMWAILADPSRSHNRWEPFSDEFFKSGAGDAQALVSALDEAGVRIDRSRCLDFGCGLGRVTQGLCSHFDRVDGVDIARSMIEGARRHNRYGERCQYHLNERDDLGLFGDATFDCIWSVLVLQHMLPEYSRKYLAEFIRVLKPGGAAVFQIPAGPAERAANGSSRQDLPNGAHQAELTILEAPQAVEAGSVFPVVVRVRNRSRTAWPATESVHIGNHWKRRRRMIVQDDGRASLPHELPPGASAEVTLYARAPEHRGKYNLELDMVEELITWFADRGSPTTAIEVRVTAPLTASIPGRAPKDLPAVPEIEMHFLSPSEVTETVAAAGGTVVDVSAWDYNPAYEDYRYIAVRPPSP